MNHTKILLVEDNCDCEELALRALRKAGFVSVEVVRDGAEALFRLLGDPVAPSMPKEQPSFVLLDLKLPKIDGVDVLKRIRNDARTRGLKVIALSASENPEEIESCRSLGVTAILTKPLDTDALKRSLVC
jgi:CheY-like chemotaxis protein